MVDAYLLVLTFIISSIAQDSQFSTKRAPLAAAFAA